MIPGPMRFYMRDKLRGANDFFVDIRFQKNKTIVSKVNVVSIMFSDDVPLILLISDQHARGRPSPRGTTW